MFEHVEAAPPDPILGLNEAFRADPRPNKINLGVGVFVDESGVTPVLDSVATAERRLADQRSSKSYLPILGSPQFGAATRRLCFGTDEPDHVVTAGTPGGTGALRVAAELLAGIRPTTTVWLPDPTWANHHKVFAAAGLDTSTYPYFDPASHGVNGPAMLDALDLVPAGDVVVVHACCHNPTGADLDPALWAELAEVVTTRDLFPLFDFAYQGFGDGIEADAAGVRMLAASGLEHAVAQSFSKNFGLYQDRVGALHVVCDDAGESERVASQMKTRIRANYSNPPAHGGNVVTTILEDPELSKSWRAELDGMRARIHDVRHRLLAALRVGGVSRDFGFLAQQRGMFSFTGLTSDEVDRLRGEHAVYMVGSGRINVAGITTENLPRLAEAMVDVLG